MNKTITFLAALCMTTAANATILRVSNVEGSTAPYKTLKEAHGAAAPGDTIMVDGSSTAYTNFTIEKTIVLIGPGFWLVENQLSSEARVPAMLNSITVKKTAEGTVIEGMYLKDRLTTEAPKTVVRRCRIFDESFSGGGLLLNARNCVAHQNFVSGIKTKAFYVEDYNDQITNNIILGSISSVGGSYIAYNTFVADQYYNTDEGKDELHGCFGDVINSTIEHNIIPRTEIGSNGWNDVKTNSMNQNHVYGPAVEGRFIDWSSSLIDSQVQEATQTFTAQGYGAFAGDDPYVISGIPAGPVITDITMPTTVEKGNKLNVTIKVDVSR